jgi:hypothetical protein
LPVRFEVGVVSLVVEITFDQCPGLGQFGLSGPSEDRDAKLSLVPLGLFSDPGEPVVELATGGELKVLVEQLLDLVPGLPGRPGVEPGLQDTPAGDQVDDLILQGLEAELQGDGLGAGLDGDLSLIGGLAGEYRKLAEWLDTSGHQAKDDQLVRKPGRERNPALPVRGTDLGDDLISDSSGGQDVTGRRVLLVPLPSDESEAGRDIGRCDPQGNEPVLASDLLRQGLSEPADHGTPSLRALHLVDE